MTVGSVRELAIAASRVERTLRKLAPPKQQGKPKGRWQQFAARLSAIAGDEDLGEEQDSAAGEGEDSPIAQAAEALLAALYGGRGRGNGGGGRGRGRGGGGRGTQGAGRGGGGTAQTAHPPGKPGKPVLEQGGYRGTDGRLVLRVECWKRGNKGHFSDKCPFEDNPPGNR